MTFQTCMTYFLLWNTHKKDIFEECFCVYTESVQNNVGLDPIDIQKYLLKKEMHPGLE